MRQAARSLTHLGCRRHRSRLLASCAAPDRIEQAVKSCQAFSTSSVHAIDDYSKHPKDRVEPPHDPKFDRPLTEFWKQAEARKHIEIPDDSWSNPYNVSIMPEEVRYPDTEYTPTQKLLHTDILERVNQSITDRSHNRMFVVVHIAGRQYKLSEDDMVSIPGTFHAEFGQKLYLQKILCAGCADFSLFGRPILDRNLVRVHATVIEKTLAATTTYYYFLRKMKQQQYRYLRIPQTVLRINQIEFMRRLDEGRPMDLMPQGDELSATFATDAGKLSNFDMPDRPWYPMERQKKIKVRSVLTTGIPGVKGGEQPPVSKGVNRLLPRWKPKSFE